MLEETKYEGQLFSDEERVRMGLFQSTNLLDMESCIHFEEYQSDER